MKRTDIERMISLADDRYIDEIFQDKITGRRRNIFVTFAAVAAALAVVAGGIGYLVSTAGNADKITANDHIVSELGIVDYSLYFQNKDESAMEVEGDSGVLSEATGISCYFPDSESEYVRSVMPFDMSGYVYTDCQFAYNYKDDVIGIMMHANNRTEDKQENVKMLNVEVYERGVLFPHISLGKIKSMKRFDVDVYGFDFDNTIGVIFASGGKEYIVSGNYTSYDEIGLIMDSLIENGLWADRFDFSKAEVLYNDISADITLEQANGIEPFAGHVPQIHKFGDMRLNFNKVSYSAGRDENNGIVPKWLYFTYYDGGDQDICLQYFTDAAGDEVQHIETTVAIEDIELDKLSEFRDDGNNHTFAIDFGNFKVNVWTNNCTDNELLHCITAMQIGANGTIGYSSREISLIEANNIVPFAGYVPKVENIGGMHLASAYCVESSFNGAVEDNTITFKYLEEETNKYITLYYTCEYADPFAYYAESFTEEELKSLEQQSELGDPDCRNYSFSLDCGDFRINVEADCTPAEMIKCVMFINGLPDYSYGEEATKQFNLSQANMEKPYAGYVPQCMTIGSMSLANVYTSNSLMHFEGSDYTTNLDIGKSISVFYQSSYQADPFEYISLHYVTASPSSGTVVAFGDSLNKLESLAMPSKQNNYHCNYYNFSIDCGDFRINVGAECTPGEMEQCIRGIWDSKDYTQYNITELSLDEARANPLTAGLVPQTNTIGDMSLENGTCKLYDGERIVIKYSNPSFKYDDERFNYYGKYLTASYTKNDGSEEGVTVFDDIEPAPTIDLNDNGVGKYKFTLDCGNIYIRVEALCNYSEMWEFLKELKNAAKGNSAHSDGQTGVRMSNGINLVDSTLSAANKIKPFAGYIPQSESFGSLKLSAVSEGYFDGDASPCLIHMVYVDDLENPKKTMTAHFYSDYKAVFLDEPKVSAIPLDDITPEKAIPGKSLLVDCGDFKIFIGASSGCSKEDIWRFINGVKGLTTYDAGDDVKKLITMGEVKELAKKGDDLTWSDFEAFSGKDIGSGLYIMAYDVEGTDFTVAVGGGSLDEKPMYIHFGRVNDDYIDIRYDSIDDFLNEKMLTMDDIKELAKKGDELTWSDFDGYVFSEGGSGLYIRMYNVKGGYTLAIGGGGPGEKPMYIYLSGKGKRIDIRYDSIDDFLNEKPFLSFEF
ncbi:MAG: hypothetical protein K2N71_11190 [Oscillospiraceae bacterium]|nr:hypothetical protein [Oscillospiraceae bacterium]